MTPVQQDIGCQRVSASPWSLGLPMCRHRCTLRFIHFWWLMKLCCPLQFPTKELQGAIFVSTARCVQWLRVLTGCRRSSLTRLVLPLFSCHPSLLVQQAPFGNCMFLPHHHLPTSIRNPGPSSHTTLPISKREDPGAYGLPLIPLYNRFLHFFLHSSIWKLCRPANIIRCRNEDNVKIKVLLSFLLSVSPKAWAQEGTTTSQPRHLASTASSTMRNKTMSCVLKHASLSLL